MPLLPRAAIIAQSTIYNAVSATPILILLSQYGVTTSVSRL